MKRLLIFCLAWGFWSDSAFAQGWGPIFQLSTAPNGRSLCTQQSVGIGDSSRVHVVWTDSREFIRGVYYRRSQDGGLTWGLETRLTDPVSISNQAALATDRLFSLHVAWREDRDSTDQIYYKRSTDAGQTWGPDTRLTFYRYSGKGYPALVSDQNAWVHLCWADNRLGPSLEEVFYKRSTDQGSTWTPDTALTLPPNDIFAPSIATSGLTVHLAWDARPGGFPDSTRVFYRRSTDGGVAWDSVRQLNTSVYQANHPSIAADDSGLVHVVWYDYRTGSYQLYYCRSTDDGVTWQPEVRLTSGYAALPSAATGPDGMVGVAYSQWYSSQRYGIAYRQSTDAGLSWGPEEWVSDTAIGYHRDVSIAIDPQGRAHAVWNDSSAALPYWKVLYRRREAGVGVEANPVPSPVSPLPFSVHPNPFTSFTILPGHEAERFLLYDISGRVVGTYRGDRIGEGLTPGVYFLRPEQGSLKPLRIVKLK